MGCTTSNLNDLPAVALCRQRCAFLHETIRHCYALSAAHLSYINSLQSTALSLQQLHFTSPSPSLPPHSDSDHHNEGGGGGHYFHPPPFTYSDQISYPQGHISFPAAAYMKHNATPSQVYEQMPTSPHAVHMGQYSSFYSSSFSHANPHPSDPCYRDQTFGGGSGGYYSSAPPYGPESSAVASFSQPPPRIYSPWDFHNSYYDEDAHYSQHRTSRELKEIREEEGIPDLEEDDDDEVVKPVQRDETDADDGAGNHSKFTKYNQADLTEASLNQTMPIGSVENDDGVQLEHEVHADEERFREPGGPRDAFEVASEVEVQFRKASESGMEIARILEGGTLPYYPKHGAYQGKSSTFSSASWAFFFLPFSLLLLNPIITSISVVILISVYYLRAFFLLCALFANLCQAQQVLRSYIACIKLQRQ